MFYNLWARNRVVRVNYCPDKSLVVEHECQVFNQTNFFESVDE